jgi:DNA mismatch endonuclease (patch repair protein)
MMSRIHGRGNKDTELVLAKLFRLHSIKGWRRNQQVFGKPDFIFPKLKLAIFVDGCFWHGCPKHGTNPKSNRAYWHQKLFRNKSRDHLVTRTLRQAGWRVLRIWEHELTRQNEPRLLRRLERTLKYPG